MSRVLPDPAALLADAPEVRGRLSDAGWSSAALVELLGEGYREHLDRDERSQQLTDLAPDFSDLDDRFFEIQPNEEVDGRVMSFIRARPADFYFDGVVELPVRPGS